MRVQNVFSNLNLAFKKKWSVFINTLNGQMINFILAVNNEKKISFTFSRISSDQVTNLSTFKGSENLFS